MLHVKEMICLFLIVKKINGNLSKMKVFSFIKKKNHFIFLNSLLAIQICVKTILNYLAQIKRNKSSLKFSPKSPKKKADGSFHIRVNDRSFT